MVLHCPEAYTELFLIMALGVYWAALHRPASLVGAVSRPKKEPRDRDRDIQGLLNKGFENGLLLYVADSGQDKAEILAPWG